MASSFRFYHGVFLAALLVSACATSSRTGGSYAGSGASENLLSAQEGEMHAVEEDQVAANDPMQAHLNARRQVVPTNLDSSAQYTKHEEKPGAEDTHFRTVRLEGEVSAMRKQMPRMMPAKSGLITSDRQTIETRPVKIAAHPMQKQVSINPAPVQTQVVATLPGDSVAAPDVAPASGSSAAAVVDVRTGEHPGKTRVVLDLSGPSDFHYNLDNAHHVLQIDLPGAAWNTGQAENFGTSPFIAGYTATPSPAGGTTLAISLKQSAKLLMSTSYPPNDAHGDRIVFDVGPG